MQAGENVRSNVPQPAEFLLISLTNLPVYSRERTGRIMLNV